MGKRDWRRTRGPAPGGIDPSTFGEAGAAPRVERKQRQLCREVRDVVSLTLATLEDGALVDAWVAAVLPGGDAAHVRVLVVVPPGGDAEATSAALERVSGLLRREVAQAIVRKRAPLLAFEVHLDGGAGERDPLEPEPDPERPAPTPGWPGSGVEP